MSEEYIQDKSYSTLEKEYGTAKSNPLWMGKKVQRRIASFSNHTPPLSLPKGNTRTSQKDCRTGERESFLKNKSIANRVGFAFFAEEADEWCIAS